jgi:hypothetical protein
MATKKKSKKKTTKKKAAGKKAAPAKAIKRPKKAKKKVATKTAVSRPASRKKPVQKAPERASGAPRVAVRHPVQRRGSWSGEQAGDLQGLSHREGADSESVDELLEEGNAFEAEAVSGVEAADNEEGREVHTHEVPEDDVPEEYLDEK